jgi:hypothetical protein
VRPTANVTIAGGQATLTHRECSAGSYNVSASAVVATPVSFRYQQQGATTTAVTPVESSDFNQTSRSPPR